MEYIHTDDCQIRSDIAFRLGKIILQYEESIHVNDIMNYSSTLYISVLQTLLTNCLEILREIKFKNEKYEFFDIDQEWILTKADLRSKSANTPFIGKKMKGRAVAVINNNKITCVQ